MNANPSAPTFWRLSPQRVQELMLARLELLCDLMIITHSTDSLYWVELEERHNAIKRECAP
jgi:hypothetical protein